MTEGRDFCEEARLDELTDGETPNGAFGVQQEMDWLEAAASAASIRSSSPSQLNSPGGRVGGGTRAGGQAEAAGSMER